MKGWREGIAMMAGLGNAAPGFAQAGIIDGHSDQALRTIGQGATEKGGKYLLGIPGAARVEEVFRTPTVVLAAIGPDDAGQRVAPQTQQAAQGMANGTEEPVAIAGLASSNASQRGSREKLGVAWGLLKCFLYKEETYSAQKKRSHSSGRKSS